MPHMRKSRPSVRSTTPPTAGPVLGSANTTAPESDIPDVVSGGKPPKQGFRVSLANREIVLTRRHFLYGAVGAGVAAAAYAGSKALKAAAPDTPTIETLEVTPEQVFSQEDCTEIPADYLVNLVGDFTLPYGSLVWVNDETWAACLLPTETPSPLTQVALLSLETGEYYNVIDQAQGAADGFEIYDVRATSSGVVWTEANIFEGLWRIYAGPLSPELSITTAALLEEGNAQTETPTLAAVGDYCFWQVMPQASLEDANKQPAYVRRATFGATSPETVFETTGRFAAPIYACENAVVFAPHHEDSNYHYQLMHMDATTGQVGDSLTLPQSMHPNQLGYGTAGFAFCFDAIYENDYGIANLGTYTPAALENNDYNAAQWFHFSRTPLGSPAWCGNDYFLVKSTKSVCVVDLANKRYSAIDIADGSADWGDYLVSSGVHNTFVTSMQVDYVDTQNQETHNTQVRLWQALPAEERLSTEEILERVQAEEEAKNANSTSESDLGPSTNAEGTESDASQDQSTDESTYDQDAQYYSDGDEYTA